MLSLCAFREKKLCKYFPVGKWFPANVYYSPTLSEPSARGGGPAAH